MKRASIFFTLILCSFGARAFDFGGSSEYRFDFTGAGVTHDMRASAWWTMFFNNGGRIDAEASVNGKNENGVWSSWWVPEKFNFYIKSGRTKWTLGRFFYEDKSALIASGIFDGIKLDGVFTYGSASLAAFYTGLLHKKLTEIIMTGEDERFFYDDKNIFAPRKFFARAEVELNDIFGYNNEFFAGGTILTDVTKDGRHGMYFVSAGTLIPVSRSVLFNFVSVVGIKYPERTPRLHTAGFAGMSWSPPSAANDTVVLSVLWTSGPADPGSGQWTPITNHDKGDVWEIPAGNLACVKAEYLLDFIDILSLRATFRNYFRTSYTVPVSGITDRSGEFSLGQEFFCAIRFSPWTDLCFDIDYGFFMPNEKLYAEFYSTLIWKFSLGVTLAL